MRRLDSQEYKNPICQKCIKRQIKKYGSFSVKCQGITVETDVKLAMKNGLTEDEARWIFDPVYFFEKVYGSPVRHYQHRLLYCTSNNITARQCRQTGKTLLVMYRIFQYILTNENKTVLVVAPQEVQLKKIWDEYIFRDFIYKNKDIEQSISGRPTMSPNYQIKFDNGSKIILMIAGPGCRGQCNIGESLVFLADKTQKKIKDIDVGEKILSFNDKTLKFEEDIVTAKHNNGMKPIIKVTTKSGKTVQTTDNHPYWTQRGWVEASNLTLDDWLCTPKEFGFGDNNNISIDEAKLCAYLIGDGNLTTYKGIQKIGFSAGNNIIKDEFINICKKLYINYRAYIPNNRCCSIQLSTNKNTYCYKLLSNLGLLGKYSYEKFIPEEILNSKEEILKEFINRLYSTGGSISCKKPKKNHNDYYIEYTTTSEQLAKDLQFSLQRFGIHSAITTRQKKECFGIVKDYRRQYRVNIKDKYNIKLFLDKIGLIFGKEECSRNAYNSITNPRTDTVISLNKFINSDKIQKYINSDILWEKIKSIEYSDKKETFNLTVKKNETFIVDSIVTHNTASVIYIDEAAIITKDILSDIMMTVASNADEASVIMTSTPKGRGNPFYDACNDNKEFVEFHTSIYDVEEMKSQILRFKKLLGETGFIQECEAEFPDASGGPFNYNGIDLSKKEYEYEDQIPDEIHNEIYFGGVDWNGPNVGTYFYVIAFNTETYNIRTVDKSVVSSAVWNSTVAKNEFIRLNRKWKPKHWMVDAGFGHGTYEELKLYSVRVEQDRTCVPSHPDAMIKHILEPVNFGGWTEIEDPFTKEIVKKTTKSFIVSQISRLFEPNDGKVPVSISASDHELIKCLENYKLINITSKGVEQYGFDKKGDIEDHPIDSWGLAIYGIIKYYSDLFKRIVAMSVSIDAKSILAPKVDKDNSIHIDHSQSIVLLTDNSPELIYLDERSLKKYEPKDESLLPVVTRTFNKNMQKPRNNAFKRNRHIISRTNF